MKERIIAIIDYLNRSDEVWNCTFDTTITIKETEYPAQIRCGYSSTEITLTLPGEFDNRFRREISRTAELVNRQIHNGQFEYNEELEQLQYRIYSLHCVTGSTPNPDEIEDMLRIAQIGIECYSDEFDEYRIQKTIGVSRTLKNFFEDAFGFGKGIEDDD